MRLISRITLAMLAVVVALPMVAAFAGEGQVAVVRLQEVFRQSTYAKQMEAQIKASFAQEERAIEDQQKLLKSEQEKLASNALLDPNSYQYKEKVMKIQLMELKYRDMVQRFTSLSRSKMATYWKAVYADFQTAINRVASTGQFSVIMTTPDIDLPEQVEKTNSPEMMMTEILQRRVMYINPQVDVTDQVIKVMNEINQKRGNAN